MIEVERLTKDYGTVVAVRDVSFSVGKGEIVGFLGPNGAGKSTTMRILVGFLGATSGRVRVAGHDIVEDSQEARRAIGYMPESAPLYPEMRVREYLAFRAAVKKVARAERKRAVERAMSLAVVTEMADTVIGHLSKGYRQRVGLADALVANPPLLILDEPTAGLDPNQIREVRRLIRELGESHTILLSTHILSEVESTCDRAIVIARGRLVAEGSIDELRARRRADGAVVTVRGDRARAVSLLEALPGVRRVKARKGDDAELSRVTLTLAKGESNVGAVLEAAVGALCAAGLGVREAGPSRATLEDVFAELTRDEADAAAEQETEE
ncbi:MAG: ATP-binding cassette domain-containing protein [Polyangiaceae bacterium]|nr:ATP-binding cassette domain-containing protein [Polyangiaceae bacterium]MCL4755414.1 ATP-binding cassette domain-containing protein [Myxococcales bacterium]